MNIAALEFERFPLNKLGLLFLEVVSHIKICQNRAHSRRSGRGVPRGAKAMSSVSKDIRHWQTTSRNNELWLQQATQHRNKTTVYLGQHGAASPPPAPRRSLEPAGRSSPLRMKVRCSSRHLRPVRSSLRTVQSARSGTPSATSGS